MSRTLMNLLMPKLWFSLYDFTFNYKGDEPSFVDDASFDWSADFAQNYTQIWEELSHYLQDHDLKGYFNTSIISKPKSWKTISLKTWDINLYKNQKHFPFTTVLLNKYPEILSLSFNLLDPQSSILPHCGDTNGIYRCHLGLHIPSGLPECGFSVREEKRAWENGKWLVFMDAYNHEAFNNTDEPRFILLMDVIRKEFSGKRNRIASTVKTSLFLQKRAEKFKFLLKMPPFLIFSIAVILTPFAYIATKVVNVFKIY